MKKKSRLDFARDLIMRVSEDLIMRISEVTDGNSITLDEQDKEGEQEDEVCCLLHVYH